jgi:uncharacterized protein YjbI with pentapeptide repeats
MYLLLRDGHVEEFNERRTQDETFDLRQCNFRGVDLRGLDAAGLDLTNAYLRGADLRGLDLRETNLRGVSLAHALVSGAYFAPAIRAEEIMMSVQYGTRLRY